ncbi:MAG TPA: hypothetical protein VKG38_14380 [Solirubrobacteraceae bacterium]|nr:hypothetical protein [Solirubrobacteraceae bacterium]
MSCIVSARRARSGSAALFTAMALVACVPTAASAACAPSPTSTPFAQFGDHASYSLVQGGSFESGAPGWSLSGSTVVAGNESYNVAGGSHSLAIQPTGAAVSPSFCVSIANPSFRFFARRTSGSWGVLNVILVWTEASGTTHDTTVAAIQSGTSWTVSPILQLATTLPLWQAKSTLSVRLMFKPEQYGGAWAIDDVYIDPYSR